MEYDSTMIHPHPRYGGLMKVSKHGADRMVKRGIKQAVINVVYAYGIEKGDKVVLTARMAAQRLEEAREEMRQWDAVFDFGGGSISDAMHRSAALEAEIRALEQVVRTRGATVVCVGDTLITTYRGSVQIKIH